jgi:hypothetical protein
LTNLNPANNSDSRYNRSDSRGRLLAGGVSRQYGNGMMPRKIINRSAHSMAGPGIFVPNVGIMANGYVPTKMPYIGPLDIIQMVVVILALITKTATMDMDPLTLIQMAIVQDLKLLQLSIPDHHLKCIRGAKASLFRQHQHHHQVQRQSYLF